MGGRATDAGDVSTCRVVFLCTGNICRSPMGDVVLRQMAAEHRLADGTSLAEHLDVASAGTGNWHAGQPMDPRAQAALQRRGYLDCSHVAQAFETHWLEQTDLVVCMDRGHRQTLASKARHQTGDHRHEPRLVLLRSFDPHAGGDQDVPDPYYGDDDGFERCLDLVEAGCRGLIEHLADRLERRDER